MVPVVLVEVVLRVAVSEKIEACDATAEEATDIA